MTLFSRSSSEFLIAACSIMGLVSRKFSVHFFNGMTVFCQSTLCISESKSVKSFRDWKRNRHGAPSSHHYCAKCGASYDLIFSFPERHYEKGQWLCYSCRHLPDIDKWLLEQ